MPRKELTELEEWILLQLCSEIPPRGPRGSPQCKMWEQTTRRFERFARKIGLDPFEAYKLCREKSASAAISQST